MNKSRIIVALKGVQEDAALSFAIALQGKVWGYKINDLIIRNGIDIIPKIKAYGNVMADVKTYEIDDDMKNEVELVISSGADIVTIHCSADFRPQTEYCDRIAGVTILTTFDHDKCIRIYNRSVNIQINNFIDNVAIPYKYGNIVCSAHDLRDLSLRNKLSSNNIKIICPAIRPSWIKIKNDDQKRSLTPYEAIINGADYLVIGRPIMNADDPFRVVNTINQEVDDAIEFLNSKKDATI